MTKPIIAMLFAFHFPKRLGILSFLSLFLFGSLFSQSVPRPEEGIEYMVTFGQDAPGDWGDDDHVQVYFFMVPASAQKPMYIRIFDPDVGGEVDENRGGFNTRTEFSLYGGKGTFTNKDAKNVDPLGQYDAGTILATKTFGSDSKYDGKWYSFGPINPIEGESFDGFGNPSFIFKLIVRGRQGDDGNLYRFFLSTSPDKNIEVEGGDTFTYEYSFRLPPGKCHIYPYIDQAVVSIHLHNYDFDRDGFMKVVSQVRPSSKVEISNEGDWKMSVHKIYDEERDKVIDIQITSLGKKRNNNVVFYVLNQYGETLPFFNFPIGLVPRKSEIMIVPDR